MEIIALVLAVLLFLAGLVGTVLPVLPGAILVYAGMLLYGLMTHFKSLNAVFFILQAIVLVLIFLIDFSLRRPGQNASVAANRRPGERPSVRWPGCSASGRWG
jgi:uncharacterized protein YqgC (DUF456 family)